MRFLCGSYLSSGATLTSLVVSTYTGTRSTRTLSAMVYGHVATSHTIVAQCADHVAHAITHAWLALMQTSSLRCVDRVSALFLRFVGVSVCWLCFNGTHWGGHIEQRCSMAFIDRCASDATAAPQTYLNAWDIRLIRCLRSNYLVFHLGRACALAPLQ